MGGALCCDNRIKKQKQKNNSTRASNSFIEFDKETITINNTELTLISHDLYKFNKQTKVGSIFNIQDCDLQFTDKTFKSHVGESVVKECANFIKLNEDLCLNNVMHTSGGNANCDYIIHGCFKKDSNIENDAENLRILITETLTYANKLQCSSVVFPLHQLKTNCSKTCSSVVLGCQSFINENYPINIKIIYFVGSEENTLRRYRNALYTIQRINMHEDTQQSYDSYNNKDKILQFDSSNIFEKTERDQSKNIYQQNQFDFIETPPRLQTSVLKSQKRTNSNQQSDGNEQFNSQHNKSALKQLKNHEDNHGFRQDEAKIQSDLDISKNQRANSEQYSIQNINNKRSSLQSGINKESTNYKSKTPLKKQLDNYNYKSTILQEFLIDEQHQIEKDLKKKSNTGKNRKLKPEFLSTNITQNRDDEISDKEKSLQEDVKYESFFSDMESEQITALMNAKNQNYCEDSLLNQGLNLNQESIEPNYLSSNIQSNRFISFV